MPESEAQIAAQIPKRRSGNPAWVKGVSGNPAGGESRAVKQARRDRLVAQIAGDLAVAIPSDLDLGRRVGLHRHLWGGSPSEAAFAHRRQSTKVLNEWG
jgi:hypothetical protein